jgi:hypothetical protein
MSCSGPGSVAECLQRIVRLLWQAYNKPIAIKVPTPVPPDQHYGTNGGYIVLDNANTASAANPSTGPNFFTNPRAFVPAAPFAIYGGAKIKLW